MPENGVYLYTAYIAAAVIYGGYALALLRRVRRSRGPALGDSARREDSPKR